MLFKGRVKCILSVALFINAGLLAAVAGLILFSFNDAGADGPSRSFEGLGYEKRADPMPFIDVDYPINLGTEDWSITLIGQFDNLNDSACTPTDVCGPTDTNMLAVYNRDSGNPGGALLLHLEQFGAQRLSHEYLTGVLGGYCLTVDGFNPDDDSPFIGCDQSLLPEYTPDSFELEESAWYYFTITHDASEDTLSYYINGELETAFTIDIGEAYDNSGLLMGVNRSRETQFLDGNIAQFRLFSDVLEPSEVRAWYENNIRPSGDLEIEYLFQGLENEVVRDTSGNNRDAEVINFVDWSTEAPHPWYSPPGNSTLQEFTVPEPVSLRILELPEQANPGEDIALQWAYNRGISFINLYWRATEEGEWQQINKDRIFARQGRYLWTIPDDIATESLYIKIAGNDLLEDFIEVEAALQIRQETDLLGGQGSTGVGAGGGVAVNPEDMLESGEGDIIIEPGMLVQGESFDAIYLISKEGERRPIVSKAIFDSHAFLRGDVKIISDEQLSALPIGNPLLPRPGESILAFDAITGEYIPLTDDFYGEGETIALVPDEELVSMLLGPMPEDYVLQLPVYFFQYYDVSTVTEKEALRLLKWLAR
jgi:hypothetical protein